MDGLRHYGAKRTRHITNVGIRNIKIKKSRCEGDGVVMNETTAISTSIICRYG